MKIPRTISKSFSIKSTRTLVPCLAVGPLLIFAMLCGCASNLARNRLEGVAKGWCETIRASQVIPVYPLTEDLAVGDVFLTQMTINNQASEYDDKGFLPLDDHQVRLPYTNFSKIYFDAYWKDQFGGTNTPHPIPVFTNTGPVSNQLTILTSAQLPRAAFPTYSVQAQSGAGFSAAFPIQGIPVALSYLNSQQVNASVTIADARTYAGDPSQLFGLLRVWASDPIVKTNLQQSALNAAPTQIFLRVVSRVYYARAVDVSLQRSDSQGIGAKAGNVADPSLLTNTSNTNAVANYTNLLSTLTAAAATAASAVSNAAQVGGAVKFVWASSSTVGLSQSFDTLLAIGYLGFDVPVYTNGTIGFPIPTFQHITGKIQPNDVKSARNAMVFDTAAENHMIEISQAYQAATNKAEIQAVVSAVTGKTDYNDLVRTGTKQQWNDVYWTLKHRSLLP